MFIRSMTLAAGALLSACVAPSPAFSPDIQFMKSMSEMCGKAFEGQLVSTDEVDASFAAEKIVMHVRDCSPYELKIPLHVGDNRSRTWIITRTDDGLRLKHDHRHDDGHADEVTMYGGDSPVASLRTVFAFPADDFSKAMFDETGIPDSKQNTWVIELSDDQSVFAYQMSRPNRMFRLEFDLSKRVETPPPAWGHE